MSNKVPNTTNASIKKTKACIATGGTVSANIENGLDESMFIYKILIVLV